MKKDVTTLASIIVPTYNRASVIGNCIKSLLNQTHHNIEIIISDDGSTDNTLGVVNKFHDKRIIILKSDENLGPSVARNEGIKRAKGRVVFFTDDDVEVSKTWIKNGLVYFSDPKVMGVEGRIEYVKKNYKPCFSDRVVENLKGGEYMTANIAYRRDILISVGMFNESLRLHEDRDLAFRIMEIGKIIFSESSLATHCKCSYTIKSYFDEARNASIWLSYNKVRKENSRMFLGFIYEPLKYVVLLLPPLVLTRVINRRVKSEHDLLLLTLIYPRLWWERILIWRWALSNHEVII